MGYVTLAYANEYISPNPHVGTKWDALSDENKTKWITFSEQQMNNIEWLGLKTDIVQEDSFPRDMLSAARATQNWDYYSDYAKARIVDTEGVIPEVIYDAVCETIMGWFRTTRFQALLDLQGVNVDNFKAGSATFDFEQTKSTTPLPPKAWILMQYYSRAYWETPALKFVERV